MSVKIEVIPVTSNEAVRVMGSLNIEELEHLLDSIKVLRSNNLPNNETFSERLPCRTREKSEIVYVPMR